MRLLFWLLGHMIVSEGFVLRNALLLRKIRSPESSHSAPPAPSDPAFTPFRPVPNTNSQPTGRQVGSTGLSPSGFRPFTPNHAIVQNSKPPPSPPNDRTNPFPPFPLQQQDGSAPSGAFSQQQQIQQQPQQQPPLMAAIERAKSYKKMMDRAKNPPNAPSGGQADQGNMTNLCVNRREGQLQGQIVSQSSMDLNVQGWSKEGPYGFRSGSTWRQPTVFGANWGGPYYVRDC